MNQSTTITKESFDKLIKTIKNIEYKLFKLILTKEMANTYKKCKEGQLKYD